MIRAYLILGAIVLCSITIYAQQSRLDSLLEAVHSAEGVELIDTYNEISWEYRSIDLDSSLHYGSIAVKASQELGDSMSLAAAYNSLADSYEAYSEYDSSLTYHERSLAIKLALADSIGIANSYNNLGIINDLKGNYETALTYYFQALELYERHAVEFHKVPMVCSNVGIIYKQMEDYDKAFAYYNRAVKIYRAHEYEVGEVIVTGNMSGVLLLQEKYDSTIIYAQRAANMYESLGYGRYVSYMESNIAIAYDSLGQYDQSQPIYLRINKEYQADSNWFELSANQLNLANSLRLDGSPDQSIPLIEQALARSLHEGFQELELRAYRQFHLAYASLQNFSKAYAYQRKHFELTETIHENEKTKSILEVEAKYQNERKERLLALEREKFQKSEFDRAQQELEISEKNNLIMLLIGCIIIGITVTIILRQLLIRRKENEKSAALVLEQRKGLDAIIQAQEDERSRIAKDLHDGIGQKLSSIKMAIGALSKQQDQGHSSTIERLDSIQSMIDQSAQETRAISHQMMPISLKSVGLAASLEYMCEESFSDTSITHSFETFNLTKEPDEKTGLVFYRIGQELVNNILKHSQARNVEMQLYVAADKLVLAVSDNGVGLDPNKVHFGMGIQNIRTRLSTIDGQLNISSDGQGATFTASAALNSTDT
ncbi:tetratricopeptide repeat-containing sensor histidine kinase [Sanyastnella coralliicola]|uniref:tetratricopeptide repeat-containing sensor histidine kinase n=1 Tax=Sanyastnella coralliicola TaxID=3069118 RepID=UPI0027BB0C56|nr:sensor histidine kinase [Longitalea sp. SCSIO 12813]